MASSLEPHKLPDFDTSFFQLLKGRFWSSVGAVLVLYDTSKLFAFKACIRSDSCCRGSCGMSDLEDRHKTEK